MSPAQGSLLKGHLCIVESRAFHLPAHPLLPGLWFQVFLKDLSTCARPTPLMRLGLWLGSWPKTRQRLLGWGGGREYRMGQLPLGAAKMSLAAVGVVKGLGDSPLTQPGTNTLLPLTHAPWPATLQACQSSE